MTNKILDLAKKVFEIERKCVKEVQDQLDHHFVEAIELILSCKGKVIITGMGKSGIIGQKIAATMASTGTLAIFLHPSEAAHGDLGMVHRDDVLMTIGKSGESEELIHILPVIRKMGVKIISLVGNLNSTVAKLSDININIKVSEEASSLKLAPTSSTTASLVMGDAIAMVLQELKEFKSEDFALFHPAGQLGKRLLLTVEDVMHTGDERPIIYENDTPQNLIFLMSKFGVGAIVVCNKENRVEGIVTDGDLRRALSNFQGDFFSRSIQDIMTKNPYTTTKDINAYDALILMEKERTISHLAVLDEGQKYIGLVSLHDLVKLGL